MWGFVGTANQQLPCRNDTDTHESISTDCHRGQWEDHVKTPHSSHGCIQLLLQKSEWRNACGYWTPHQQHRPLFTKKAKIKYNAVLQIKCVEKKNCCIVPSILVGPEVSNAAASRVKSLYLGCSLAAGVGGVKSQAHVVWQPTWQCREQRWSIFVQTVRSLFKWWKTTWVVPLGQLADGRRVKPLAAHREGKIINSVQGKKK